MDGGGVPSRIRLKEGAAVWRSIEGEVVALDTQASQYLAINESGAALWPLIAEGTTRDALVQALADRYGLGAAKAEADVGAFLAALAALNLLEEES